MWPRDTAAESADAGSPRGDAIRRRVTLTRAGSPPGVLRIYWPRASPPCHTEFVATRILGGLLCASLVAAPAAAQSLGQVAAEEAARRKAIGTPARVIRGDDLRSDYPVTTPVDLPAWPTDPAAAADPAAPRTLVDAAELQGGALPPIAVMAVAGGEVIVELTVNRDGVVESARTLRSTPPYSETLLTVLRGWRFAPAEDVLTPAAGLPIDQRSRRAATSKVLIVGLFRPPALFAATLGEPPTQVAAPSDDAPAVGALTMPAYPVGAQFDGTVLIEVSIGVEGAVLRRRLLRSSPPFDAPALDAVDALSFRPARMRGRAVPSVAYVVSEFRQPVTP